MNPIARWARLATTVLLGLWGWAVIRDPSETVLHNLTLPIHETGHMVFMAFGELMHAAGGSLFQILFPLVFAVYFYMKGDRHAATIPLWFAGVSAADVVPYIKDAPYGDLALIGGEHDWAFILGELTQTHNAERWGNAVLGFGALCVLASFVLGILWLPPKETK